jgi:signal transduction histidine kinase
LKLLNHTLSYLSVAFFLVIGAWALIFYINMLDEIYDSIDDGLENSKILIIQKVQADSNLIRKADFMESNYAIHEIPAERAISFRDVYKDSTLYMVNEKDYEPVRILKSAFHSPNGKYYELQIVSSMVEEDDLMEDLFYSILWLYLLLLASILIINNVLLKRIWKPFYQILEHLKRFTVETPEIMPILKTKVTEFKMLNESVAALLDRTVTTFNSQKQFIENAAHELQTPLAISINKLELLAEKNTTTDNQLQEISAVIQLLERLTRLNKTLLLLSRIENKQFSERARVNVNELVNGIILELSDFAEFKSINISAVHEGSLTLEINPELASIMFSNLLKNAIVHNTRGGWVEVKINSSSITVENTSITPALDASQIFRRFYKGTSLPTSTGLGLSIVKSIAKLYGFQLQYYYNGKHIFTIVIP